MRDERIGGREMKLNETTERGLEIYWRGDFVCHATPEKFNNEPCAVFIEFEKGTLTKVSLCDKGITNTQKMSPSDLS